VELADVKFLSEYNHKLMTGSHLTDRTRTARGQLWTGPFSVHICRTWSDGQLSDRSVGSRTVRGQPADRSVGPCPTDVNRETDRSVSGPLDLNRALYANLNLTANVARY
jgi:hypothetical protein